MTKKKRRGNGKYHDWITKEGLLKLEGWARDGLTDEQIAKNIGIVPSTLYEWEKQHPEFSEALKKGKEVVGREVENALLKGALGYQYAEVKEERDGDGGVKVTKTVKEVAPDVTAQIFWLKNRKPDTWRDRQQTEVTGKDGGPIEIQDAREKLIEKLAKGKE